MLIARPLKLILAINFVLAALYGWAIFAAINWGVDDDADLARIAWGHLALRHFLAAVPYALGFALFGFGLNWILCFAPRGSALKAALQAAWLAVALLALCLCGAAIACVRFYLARPVGI